MSIKYKVLSSMDIEVQRQEAIAKNLAGAPIPGYKGESVISSDFDGYLNQFKATGQGAVYEDTNIDFSPGAVKHTGRDLDFAIAKKGFFQVTAPNGESYYTRNGRFTLSPDGKLVTSEGFEISSDSPRGIQFKAEHNVNDINVSSDGTIHVGSEKVGRIKVFEFSNLKNLNRLSSSYFKLDEKFRNEAAEMNPDQVKMMNRTVEESNISIVKEMISMIDSMRKFEMAQKIIKSTDGLKTKELSTFGG